MRRSVKTTPTTDTSCNSYRPFYQTLTSYNEYKTSNLNTDALGNYISTSLQSDLASNTAESQQSIQTNLDALQNLELKVYNMTRCVQAEITQRSEKAGDIYKLQEQVTLEEANAAAMEQTAKEAKERASLLDKPYSKTNRHELWLPLGRPLKPESVPVLLSISILFLILSLGMFLRLVSTEFRFTSPFLAYVFPQRSYLGV